MKLVGLLTQLQTHVYFLLVLGCDQLVVYGFPRPAAKSINLAKAFQAAVSQDTYIKKTIFKKYPSTVPPMTPTQK